jgi:hypothetical protein
MVLHASIKFGLSTADRALLTSYLCPTIPGGHNADSSSGDNSNNNDGGSSSSAAAAHGWEEVVDAAVTHLLRTSLSKHSKESASLAVGAIEVRVTTTTNYYYVCVITDCYSLTAYV